MIVRRSAFTLIEVLISIALLSLVLLALYKSIDMLRSSNNQLFGYLEKADSKKQATETLFLDIAGSDGNITIEGDEFSRLCLENTVNSLYGLSAAKVCWVVSKTKNRLLRCEGNGYLLPLNSNDRVAVDAVLEDVDLFLVYRQKSEVLVILRQKEKKPISFMVHGVAEIISKNPPAAQGGQTGSSRSPNRPATSIPTPRTPAQ